MSAHQRAPEQGRPVTAEFSDPLTMFASSVQRCGDRVMVSYFDAELTFTDVDRASDAFAGALLHHGLISGDRLAIVAQNIPHFLIALIGTWKAGGIAVPANPMLSDDELRHILLDSGAAALACEVSRLGDAAWLEDVPLRLPVISMDPFDYQSQDDVRVLPARARPPAGVLEFAELLRTYGGQPIPVIVPQADGAAAITYTSGTTGLPKGAVNRHESLAFVGQVYRDWLSLTQDDRILGVPPMSTIVGLGIGVASTLLTGCRYVISYRFEAQSLLDVIRSHRPTFLVAPPTLFLALLNLPDLTPEDVSSLVHLYCGAAPVSPALVDRWRRRFAQEIRTAYGMTEATGPTHLAPVGRAIPVDAGTGALSIGVPVFNTKSRIVRPDDPTEDVAPGEPGELMVSGPQMIREYWLNTAATASTIVDGWVRTGDLAVEDDGWYFIVDRLKDIIITSGNNVSPRQVEDCLLSHDHVSEAAVVGVPDDYRGEAVHAFVVMMAGEEADADELVRYCRLHLAPYKVPRQIDFVTGLPKNIGGKVLRRQLRDQVRAGSER